MGSEFEKATSYRANFRILKYMCISCRLTDSACRCRRKYLPRTHGTKIEKFSSTSCRKDNR
jgi:hypothetical protein